MGKQLSGWQAFLLFAAIFVGLVVFTGLIGEFTPIFYLLAIVVAPFLFLANVVAVTFAVRYFWEKSRGGAERFGAMFATTLAVLQLLGFGAVLWEAWLKNWQRVINFY